MNLIHYERTYYVCYINEECEFDFTEMTIRPFMLPTAVLFKTEINQKNANPYECSRVVSWSLISYKEV
jgi:hypothetical protein